MKKILTLIFVFLIFQSCGYNPMYDKNQDVNFYIENISFDENNFDLSKFIKINLSNYLKKNNGNKFNIKTSISYSKNSISKDSAGNTEEYELSCLIKFIVFSSDSIKEIKIQEKFKMDNFADDFEERQYERAVKQNMARSIVSKLIFQLSRLDAN